MEKISFPKSWKSLLPVAIYSLLFVCFFFFFVERNVVKMLGFVSILIECKSRLLEFVQRIDYLNSMYLKKWLRFCISVILNWICVKAFLEEMILGLLLEIFFLSAFFFSSWENLSYSIHSCWILIIIFIASSFLVPGRIAMEKFISKMGAKRWGGMKLWMLPWEYNFLEILEIAHIVFSPFSFLNKLNIFFNDIFEQLAT